LACVITTHRDWLARRSIRRYRKKRSLPFIPLSRSPQRLFLPLPFSLVKKKKRSAYIPPHIVMPATYPMDRSDFMSPEGPSDTRFRIQEGVLLYHPKRDARFPYIYRISSHALVHSPAHIRIILIRVVDTSIDARISRAQFDKTLSLPLGPNALMEEYGTSLDSNCHKILILFRFIGTETWHNLIRPTLA
jgi:hypothetical protein